MSITHTFLFITCSIPHKLRFALSAMDTIEAHLFLNYCLFIIVEAVDLVRLVV